MAIYVIGDVQGCMAALNNLLDTLNYDPLNDQLWFAGDLVNRGSQSLDVLRFVRSLGDNARTVLGNHDLHALAVHCDHREEHRKDTLQDILTAPDRYELMDWLRRQPLMFTAFNRTHIVCHAGIHPFWTLAEAEQEARFVESHLRSDNYDEVFAFMYGNTPNHWKPGRKRKKRIRFAINCFTRMRYCDEDGRLDFHEKGKPGELNINIQPWYEHPERRNKQYTIMFGHWSTVGNTHQDRVIALDTGCVWGGRLTAYEPLSGRYHSVPCRANQKPGTN